MGMNKRAWLVGDIGATNARFALARRGTGRPVLSDSRTLSTADFAGLREAVRQYLHDVNERPIRAAFAVAGPIQGDEVRLSNCSWAFTRHELADTLRLPEISILNDFGAAALGVSVLEAGEYEVLNGHPDAVPTDPVSVVGPGTGMGVALLLRDRQGQWQVVETEGGHASFAAQDVQDQRLHDWLAERHGRVSIERVLSGAGLSAIHAVLSGLPPGKLDTPDDALRPPAAIVAAALANEDRIARAALGKFCAVLGSVAGDVALLHGARTIAIAGGIVPRFIPFLKFSAFRDSLLAKGRFADHLRSVNIRVVTHPAPGLLGAALSLDRVNCQP